MHSDPPRTAEHKGYPTLAEARRRAGLRVRPGDEHAEPDYAGLLFCLNCGSDVGEDSTRHRAGCSAERAPYVGKHRR